MTPEYIVVQAGGKGTRLGYLTNNKPKALVAIDNLPMIFHLFRKYPSSKFVIIGDYHYDVLEKYLKAFADVTYELVCATGKKGTCAGMREALNRIPKETPFLLIWSDLILPKDLVLPENPGNYIGVAKDFRCRWKYENYIFEETCSKQFGVAGMFVFQDAAIIKDVPEEGEFVRWLSTLGIKFESLDLYNIKEYGLLEDYKKLDSAKCRPFNRTYIEGKYFVKEAINEQGRVLAIREAAWYKEIENHMCQYIPHIVNYSPLKMEYISGKSVYKYTNLSREEKSEILCQIVACIKSVQAIGSIPADKLSFDDAYIGKTFKRLEKVCDLVPFAKDKFIIINGKKCRNVFYCRELLEKSINKYMPKTFRFIHGDCTFSNVMLRESNHTPILIDPRGYFGYTELYGDAAYDWAKLYYSVVGNYDQFNRKRFVLTIRETDVELKIESNGWEEFEGEFFDLIGDAVSPHQIHLLHAIIWLSLTTYAWEDYDSLCGAFYNGVYYLEEALNENLF